MSEESEETGFRALVETSRADEAAASRVVMTDWAGKNRRVDVVVLTALLLEYEAVLQVDTGAAQGSTWERATGPSGLPLAFRSFAVPFGRPLRIAVAAAVDLGATGATNTLLPLVDALKPRCVAMCGVCAGRPKKTELGDVVAASRLFYHDTGKRLHGQIQYDLTSYQLRDDWKAAIAGLDVLAHFRSADWFQRRPLNAEWRERRALVALYNGDATPWHDLDARTWASTVAALQERKLIDGRALTDEGRRVVDDLLFRYQGRLPDLSPAGDFQPFRLHVAPLASGSQLIEDEAIWDSIAQSVRTVMALEMEGAALGQIAHCQRQYGLDAVVMKGVMDFANQGRNDHFKPFAARASAECLLAFLRNHMQTEVTAGFDDLLTSGTVPVPEHGPPSALLVARHTVVPWHDRGRAETLAELDAWADDPRREVAVRLLHAASGIGKTRLAIEWVRRRRQRGDIAGFLGLRPGDYWLERLCGRGGPVLVVVDYAEGRAELVELLDRLARYADTPGSRSRVRILLLARGDGDWWTELQKRSDAIGALLRQTSPIALSPLATTAPDRDAVFVEAAKVFGALLGKRPISRSPIALVDPRFERVLYLHMAALAAVEEVPFEAGTLMDVILNHEERFWQTEAVRRQQAAVDLELARELVCAATLRGGISTREEAQDLFVRLVGRQRSRDDDALIGLLGRVYRHAQESQYLPGLEPDLLGEAMVVRLATARQRPDMLARDTWVDRVFIAGDTKQALTTAFIVLGRASVTTDAAIGAWISNMLKTQLSVRAILALRAAKIVTRRTAFSLLGNVLAEALERGGSPALAHALDREGIPYPTVSLQRVAIWRSQVLLENVTVMAGFNDSSAIRRARLYGQYCIELAAAGQHRAALQATRKAVTLYRQLAKRSRKTFLADLASGLSNLGALLLELGRTKAALEVVRESVILDRQLVKRNRDAFLPGLAASLNNLGNVLSKLERRQAALVSTHEAVVLNRELTAHNRDAFLPDLAMSLTNLGNRLSAVGQHEAALKATRNAIDLYRELMALNPDAFLPYYAKCMNCLANRLNYLNQRTAALEATREAVELARRLVMRNPEAFLPDLALHLHNMGTYQSELGQPEVGLIVIREAVGLWRELAARNRDAFLSGLANTLNSQGQVLNELGQREAGLEATREAVTLHRQLVTHNRAAFLPGLARSLQSLGAHLSFLGLRKPALEATQEAVYLFRRLVRHTRDAFLPDLARSLNNLGRMLVDAGQREAGLEATREAVMLYRQLMKRSHDAFVAELASNLNSSGILLSELGQREAALDATREAVGLYRQLRERNRGAFQAEFITSLNNLAMMLSYLGQYEAPIGDGNTVVTESRQLARQLAQRNRDMFPLALSTSLSKADTLSALGSVSDARYREATEVFVQHCPNGDASSSSDAARRAGSSRGDEGMVRDPGPK